jgi:hypothetical protein
MGELVNELRDAATFGGYEHDCPDWQSLCRVAADEIDRLAAIVRDLAALECPISTIVSEITGDVAGLCPTCGATLTSEFQSEIEPHEDDCPYRRAVEWMAQSAEGGG